MEAFEQYFPLFIRHVLKKLEYMPAEGVPVDAALIHAGGASEDFWGTDSATWSFDKSLGVISPLFDKMWFESKPDIPLSRVRQDLPGSRVAQIEALRAQERNRASSQGGGRKLAVLVRSMGTEPPSTSPRMSDKEKEDRAAFYAGARWIYYVQTYVETDRGFSVEAPSVNVAVSDQGHYLRHGFQLYWGAYPTQVILPNEMRRARGSSLRRSESADFAPFAEEAALSAMYALSLANARNVGLSDSQGKVQNKALRKKLPSEHLKTKVFSTINLNALHGGSEGGSGSGELPSSRRHFVRGHFKTYTEENKLLGKHVGTYFWPNHARGDQNRGEVAARYEV